MTLKLAFTNVGVIEHAAGSTISGGVFVITAPTDLKISISSLGVYFGVLTFTFSGGSAPGFVPGSVAGGGTISATAQYVKTSEGFVLREGDTGTLTAIGALPGGGTGPVSGGVVLGDPGQTKWTAE
jgi:hypothetical protein